jgi:hypothetical protein
LKRWIIRELLEVAYSLAITIAVGRWAINYAYLERGYKAVGGEYLLILMTYWVASKAIQYLFDTLEELEDERNRQKRRGRRTVRVRNHR